MSSPKASLTPGPLATSPAHSPPPSYPFSVLPAMRQYVVDLGGRVAWRFSDYDKTTKKPYGPIYFSTAETSRWNFARGPTSKFKCGALCMGLNFSSGVIEFFGRSWPGLLEAKARGIWPNPRAIQAEEQACVHVSSLTLPKGLRLYDLTKPGATSVIASELDQWLTSTRDYKSTQSWARWFFDCKDINGLVYSSRSGGAELKNIVFFNRRGMAIKLMRSVTETRPFNKWTAEVASSKQDLVFILVPTPAPAVDLGRAKK